MRHLIAIPILFLTLSMPALAGPTTVLSVEVATDLDGNRSIASINAPGDHFGIADLTDPRSPGGTQFYAIVNLGDDNPRLGVTFAGWSSQADFEVPLIISPFEGLSLDVLIQGVPPGDLINLPAGDFASSPLPLFLSGPSFLFSTQSSTTFGGGIVQFALTTVPEPSTLALAGFALIFALIVLLYRHIWNRHWSKHYGPFW